MRRSCVVDFEVGPALLVDRAFIASLRQLGFKRFVLEKQYETEATLGRCVYLRTTGMRQVEGPIEVLVDEEPSAEVVQRAATTQLGLRLEAPSGELLISSGESVTDDAQPRAALEVSVPPGRCTVDAYAFVPHEARLEEADAASAPRGTWLGAALQPIGCLLALGTAVLLVSIASLMLQGEWGALPLPLLLLVGPWAVWAGLYRLSRGPRTARDERAEQPRLPSYMLVIRSGAADAFAEGGGVES